MLQSKAHILEQQCLTGGIICLPIPSYSEKYERESLERLIYNLPLRLVKADSQQVTLQVGLSMLLLLRLDAVHVSLRVALVICLVRTQNLNLPAQLDYKISEGTHQRSPPPKLKVLDST